jgi:hypothetical protein
VNLRKLAKGQDCMIRVPEVCNFNPETTVGCHYRLSGLNGISMKPDDLFLAWGCSACHDVCDGRQNTKYSHSCIRQWHAEGVLRTQAELLKRGIIHLGKRGAS